MKLYAYEINSTPVHDLLSGVGYEVADLGGNDPFLVRTDAEAAPSNYQDISSIENWAAYGRNGTHNGRSIDYKFIRKEIYILVLTKGFTNCTTAEKEIAAQWFVVAHADRDTLYTTPQQIAYGAIHHTNSVEAREVRAGYVMMEFYNRLETADINAVMTDVSKDDLLDLYIRTGREGTLQGDPEGLFDYMSAVSGTSYSGTGFAAKAITPLDGVTLAALTDQVCNVLKDGIYGDLTEE